MPWALIAINKQHKQHRQITISLVEQLANVQPAFMAPRKLVTKFVFYFGKMRRAAKIIGIELAS